MSNEPSCVCESTSGTHHTTHHSPPMSRRALSRVMSHGVPDHHAPPSHTLLSAPQPRATKPLSHQATESPRYEWQPAQPRLVAVIAKAAEDAAGTKATGDCTGTREIRRSQYVHTACICEGGSRRTHLIWTTCTTDDHLQERGHDHQLRPPT